MKAERRTVSIATARNGGEVQHSTGGRGAARQICLGPRRGARRVGGGEAVGGAHGRTRSRTGPSQTHGLPADGPPGRGAPGRVRAWDLPRVRGQRVMNTKTGEDRSHRPYGGSTTRDSF